MPKELNLSAYDYRNNRRPSATSSNDDDDDESSTESLLRRSTGTANTYGNDTVMTGDHVEAILRLQRKTERRLRQQRQQQQMMAVAGGAPASNNKNDPHHSEEDDESSSDSEGVVPKVNRRSHSRSNSIGSTELIQLAVTAAAEDKNGGLDDTTNTTSSSNSMQNNINSSDHLQYGTAMGGNEAHHPISNLLRDRQVSNTTNSNGAINNLVADNGNGSDKGSDCDNKSSSNGSNVYHIPDNASALSSLASLATSAGGSFKSKSDKSTVGGAGDHKSFISAVLNYGVGNHTNHHDNDDSDHGSNSHDGKEEANEGRLIKSYSNPHLTKLKQQYQQVAAVEEEEFENDEESQQHHNMHQHLIDVPHYHNIRSSFTSLVGQIKDRVVENKDGASTPTPPPVSYSDRVEQQHHNDDEKAGREEVDKEQHYDLRLHTESDGPAASSSTSPNNNNNNNKRRPPRRPIYRKASIDSIWSRRLSTESESMWTVLSSSFTRRNSNGSEGVAQGRRHSNGSDSTELTKIGQQQQYPHQQVRLNDVSDDQEEDEEERDPYDDSDIRSVKSQETMDSWIGMGNLGKVIGSNIVNGDNGRMRKRGGGDGKGDYHYGNGNGNNYGVGGGGGKRRFNPFGRFVPAGRRGSMTPFVTEDGGDFFYDDIVTTNSLFYRPGMKTLRRCGAIFILIAITALSSVLIGIYIPPTIDEDIETLKVLGDEGAELFKLAESINQHCEATKLHSANGRRKCEKLCKNHLCCFDTIEDGYSCSGDESKNCGVYGGCEVLVDSFEGEVQPSETKDQVQKGEALDDVVSLDGGFGDEFEDYNDDFVMYYDDDEKGDSDPYGGDAIFWNPGGQSTTTQAEAQVGSFSVENVCNESLIKTLDGRNHCETLCKDHHCCFDLVPKKSCRTDPDKMCSTYASCEILTLDIGTDALDSNSDGTTTHEEIKIGSQAIGAACAESNVNTPSGKQECDAVCSSHHCCFTHTDFNCRSDPDKNCPAYAACEILNVIAAEEGKANGVVYYDNHQMGDNNSDPHNTVAAIQLNEEQKLQIKQVINKSCKVKTSPDCFHACRDWFCCFESSDEKSCRSSTNNLCNLVQQCEVAAVSSGTMFFAQQQSVDDEKNDLQAQPSSQQQIQQQQEDDYYQDDFLGQGPSSQQQIQQQQEDDYYQDDFLGQGPSSQMQQQDLDSQQSSLRPQQQIPQQPDNTQMQNEFQPQPSSQQQQQQQDLDLQQSSLRPQQQSPQQQKPQSSVPVPPMQQDQADLRPQPAQQVQHQQNNVQQNEYFQPLQQNFSQPPVQQNIQNQPNMQPMPPDLQQSSLRPQQQSPQQQKPQSSVAVPPMQQDQADLRPQPAQQVQQQQNNIQQNEYFQPQQQNFSQPPVQQNIQNQPNMQPMPPQQSPQQQNEFVLPQQQNNFQSQNDFRPPTQQQPIQQQNVQALPPPQYTQQVGFSQTQQQQQPITPPQQFVQPQQPMEQNNFQPPVQNLPQQQQPSTNTVVSKPPRPPPARCIPTGDDEIHTEVFNDDWNDDSYDRCKRWESKYGMKIAQYLDLYGAG